MSEGGRVQEGRGRLRVSECLHGRAAVSDLPCARDFSSSRENLFLLRVCDGNGGLDSSASINKHSSGIQITPALINSHSIAIRE